MPPKEINLIRPLLLLIVSFAASIPTCAQETQPLVQWRQLPPLPNPVGLAGGFAGVSGGMLVFAGGANFPDGPPWEDGEKVWHDAIYTLRPGDGQWRERTERLPAKRAYGISATWRDVIICVGGSDSEQHFPDAFLLRVDPENIDFQPLPPLPVPIANGAGGVLNGTLYVVAGSTTPTAVEANSDVFALDLESEPQTSRWRSLAPLPGAGRILPGLAVLQGKLFVYGGARLEATEDGTPRRQFLRDGYAYSPSEDRWHPIAESPAPICAPPVPAYAFRSDQFLSLAGDDGSLFDQPDLQDEHPGFPRKQYVYDAGANAWRSGGTFPKAIPFELGPLGNAGTWPPVTTPATLWEGAYTVISGEARPAYRTPRVWAATPVPESSIGHWTLWVTVVVVLVLIVLGIRRFSGRRKPEV